MGRPKMDRLRQKTHIMWLRLTEKQWDWLRKKAEKNSLDTSSQLRMMLNEVFLGEKIDRMFEDKNDIHR